MWEVVWCRQWVPVTHTHTHTELENTSNFRLVRETVGRGVGVTLQLIEELKTMEKLKTEHTHSYRRLVSAFEHTQQENNKHLQWEKHPPPPTHLISPLRLFVCVLDVHWCHSLISESNFSSHGRDGFRRCATFDWNDFLFLVKRVADSIQLLGDGISHSL